MKPYCRLRVPLASAAMVAAAMVLFAGCAEVDSDAGKPQEQTTRRSPSPTADEPRTEAVAAYRAMWRDLTAASRTSDADSPLLGDHASGGALTLLKYGLEKSRKQGVVSRGTPRVAPEVVSASGRKAVVVDCLDDRSWLRYKLNGELENNVPGGHSKVDATVRRDAGVWKVTDLYMHETGSC